MRAATCLGGRDYRGTAPAGATRAVPLSGPDQPALPPRTPHSLGGSSTRWATRGPAPGAYPVSHSPRPGDPPDKWVQYASAGGRRRVQCRWRHTKTARTGADIAAADNPIGVDPR